MDPLQPTPPNNQPGAAPVPDPGIAPPPPVVAPLPPTPPEAPAATTIPVTSPAEPAASVPPAIPAFEPGASAVPPAPAAPGIAPVPSAAPVAEPANGGAVSPAAMAAASAYPSAGPATPAATLSATPKKSLFANKKKLMIIGGGGLAALLLIVGGIFAITSLGGGLKLEKVTEDKFSILVPKGYVRSAEEGGLKFEEPDGEEETKSFVVAMAENYPRTPSEDEKKALLEVFEKQVPALMKSFANDGDEKVEDVTTEKVTHRGKDAISIKAKLSKGDKKAEVTMLVVVGDKGLYVAGTAVHAEDGDLAKKSDEIIKSLEFNE